MNILYLVHRIPFPPDKGDKIRSFRQLEYLARRHDVWCACFVDTPSDEQYLAPLKAYCRDLIAIRLDRTRAAARGLTGLLRGTTLTESYYANAAMQDTLRHLSRSVRFDAVVAFSSSMAPYALQVPAEKRVLDLCDLDSQKWGEYAEASHGPARWLYGLEGRRLAVKERAWVDLFDATILITKDEAAALEETVTSRSIHIIGNGVQLPPLERLGGRAAKSDKPDDPAPGRDESEAQTESRLGPVVGFVGAMDYRPNVDAVCWFASECWPAIRTVCPGAVFRIVGRSPTRRVRRLARVAGVEVVGGVDDASAEVLKFDVSVAPMRLARGLQNKVLEAMAAAKPVVLTSKAAAGVGARHSREYLIADRASEMADCVIWLLTDQTERKRLGRSARRFVAVHHCWEESLRMFELVVTGVLERTARRASLVRAKVPVPAEDQVAPAGV